MGLQRYSTNGIAQAKTASGIAKSFSTGGIAQSQATNGTANLSRTGGIAQSRTTNGIAKSFGPRWDCKANVQILFRGAPWDGHN